MLKLEKIVKDYQSGEGVFRALNGVDLEFNRGEFVSIVGPSGCGKSTALNIIAGLDQYTNGDLFIGGKSTKDFEAADWDSYRCNSVGFIFQNYNLITHLTVQSNVEMAMILSGVSKSERVERARKALKQVGLERHAYKQPNLLSGGEQQRVAIARAIVNDPDIILADEPTGALDSKTSIEIMDLIKEVSKEKLVIMVTHSRDLAQTYSSRIVEMLDGRVAYDSGRPTTSKSQSQRDGIIGAGKTAMAWRTAIELSFKNTMTKWKRALAVAAAGSIGIFGIALVLSIQNGVSNELVKMQENMFSSMPAIKIDDGAVRQATDGIGGSGGRRYRRTSKNAVVPYDPSERKVFHHNQLTEDYISYVRGLDPNLYSSLVMSADLEMNVIFDHEGTLLTSTSDAADFVEMYEKERMLELGNLVHGSYPETYTDVLLIIEEDGRVNEGALEILGLDVDAYEIDFDDISGKTFIVAYNDDYFEERSSQSFRVAENLSSAFSRGLKVTVTGILELSDHANTLPGMRSAFPEGIGFSRELADHMLENSKTSRVVASQITAPHNVLDNRPLSKADRKEILRMLGGSNIPGSISIFAKNAEASASIKAYLNEWQGISEGAAKIVYVDRAAAVAQKVNKMMAGVAMVLVAFAAISLIVSSAMIGIITYISTFERTKEIGILRSLGARKIDITRVINAETALIGTASGLIGVIVSFAVSVAMNAAAGSFFGVGQIADLSIVHAVFLISLSIGITVLAGLVPSRIAAGKDPVKALQSE